MLLARMKIQVKFKLLAFVCLFSTIGVAVFYHLQSNYINQIVADYEGFLNSTNVIVLSYAGCGSSLLGQLLSSYPNCTYFSEPLGYSCLKSRRCKNYDRYVERLVHCDQKMLVNYLKSDFWVLRKTQEITELEILKKNKSRLSDYCKSDSVHLVKTTRLRMNDAIKIAQHKRVPNLKLVHFVRDPRAQYFTLIRAKWNKKPPSVKKLCFEMENDMKLAKKISKEMYNLIRYEDLVENPQLHINILLKKLYQPDNVDETAEYLTTPTGDNQTIHNDTMQREKNNLNLWKTELEETKIREIELQCRNVLIQLEYPVF